MGGRHGCRLVYRGGIDDCVFINLNPFIRLIFGRYFTCEDRLLFAYIILFFLELSNEDKNVWKKYYITFKT